MAKKFYYTKLDVARFIAIEGFWKAAEHIDPEIILDQDLADNFRDIKDIEKINNVYYWPAYEIIKDFIEDPFDDLPHPSQDSIKLIMEAFAKYYVIKK